MTRLNDVPPHDWVDSSRKLLGDVPALGVMGMQAMAEQAGAALQAESARYARQASKSYDNVNNPTHYTQGAIECIDAIKAALTPEEFRGFCKGNALKYIWRERHKGGDESLRKAAWYIDRMVRAATGA